VISGVKPDPALELFTGLVGIAFVIVSIVGVYKFFALCGNVGAIRQMMRDREIREESERIQRVSSRTPPQVD
jgi:hypothetical protein